MQNNYYIDFIPSKKIPINITDESMWFIFIENEMIVLNINDNFLIPTFKDLYKHLESLSNYIYIGNFRDIPCYCCEISKNIFGSNFEIVNLRKLHEILDNTIFFVCGKSYQILHWHNNNKFCGRCGIELTATTHETSKECSKCKIKHYPKISPAIAVGVIRDDKILLANNKNYPSDLYSVIFGFLEPCETLEDCVKREVLEETGIHIKNIRYFSNEPWPYPDTLMISFFAEYDYGDIKVDGTEIIKADWFSKNNRPLLHEKNTLPRKIADHFFNNN